MLAAPQTGINRKCESARITNVKPWHRFVDMCQLYPELIDFLLPHAQPQFPHHAAVKRGAPKPGGDWETRNVQGNAIILLQEMDYMHAHL
jgi:hypothetical protein